MSGGGISGAARGSVRCDGMPESSGGLVAQGQVESPSIGGASAGSLSGLPLRRRQDESSASGAARPRNGSLSSLSSANTGPTQAAEARLHFLLMQATEALRNHLNGIRFAARSLDQSDLHETYIRATARLLAERTEALGDDFELATNMPGKMCSGASAALYDAFSGALSSAVRSPVRNATGVGLSHSAEINLTLTQAVLGGGVGGVTAYMAAEWVLKAADRKAKEFNFTEVVPVDLKKALPYPGAIELTISNNAKSYRRRSAPEMVRAKAAVDAQRAGLAAVQAWLSGEGEFSPYAQGLVTGALNVIRRLGDASSLLDPGTVFATSLAASAAGGFLVKGAFGLSKVSALAQTKVDNLVGAQQTINLFKVQQRDPASSAVATYGDVGRFLAGTAWETGALAFHRFDCANATPSEVLGQLKDVFNYALMNAITSVGSAGIGALAATGVRGQSQMGPAAGEAYNSPGYLMQQFFQSATNDYLWNAAKKLTGSRGSNLGDSLDSQRAIAGADAELVRLIAPENMV